MKECAGAEVSSALQDLYPKKVERQRVEVRVSRMLSFIGKELPVKEMIDILASLDIEVEEKSDDEWVCVIPTYRVDVTREADVAEEILRIYGYNNIELPEKMSMVVSHQQGVDKHGRSENLANMLTGLGFSEIMNNSLTAASYADILADTSRVEILNPLSNELSVMRSTMLWSGLEVLAYNQNRKRSDLRVFELGSVYSRSDNDFNQQEQLALFITGNKTPENWDAKARESSLYDLRAAVMQVLSKVGDVHQYTETDVDSVMFSQGVELKKGERSVAQFGVVSTSIRKKFDIDNDVFFASISISALMKAIGKKKIAVTAIPKFPMVRRDLSLLIDKSVTFGQIETLSRKAGGIMLKDVNLFDVYEGKNLPDGKRSYAVSYHLLDEDKTLVDKVVDKVMSKIQKTLETELGASLR
jgi:phenylalanyl-tRNA synthetase beta chain